MGQTLQTINGRKYYNRRDWISLSIFSVLNFLSLFSVFVMDIRLGVVSSIFILFIEIYAFHPNLIRGDYAYVLFLFLNIFSVVAYMWNGRPFIIFIAAVSYNLIPSMMYFLGKRIAIKGFTENFAEKVINANMFLIIFGLITYVFFSDFYYARVGQSLETYMWGIADYRFGSYISSINLGSVCAASIPLYYMVKNRLAKWKTIVYLPCIFVALILSMQRGAWIVATVAFLMCVFINSGGIQKNQIWKFIGALIGLFAIVAVIYAFRNVIFTIEQMIFWKKRLGTMDLVRMFGERADQFKATMDTFVKYPFGIGLGAAGHKAYSYGLSIVNDNNYFRILVELGVIGFISFIVLVTKALNRCFASRLPYIAVVLATFLMSATGSNSLDLYYSSFIFWMFLGVACSINKKEEKLQR